MLVGYTKALAIVFAAAVLTWSGHVSAEGVRVKRPPPPPEEAQDIATEIAKSDGLLRPGGIIVTSRGFLVFKGVAADGYSNEFESVPNPLNQSWVKKN